MLDAAWHRFPPVCLLGIFSAGTASAGIFPFPVIPALGKNAALMPRGGLWPRLLTPWCVGKKGGTAASAPCLRERSWRRLVGLEMFQSGSGALRYGPAVGVESEPPRRGEGA